MQRRNHVTRRVLSFFFLFIWFIYFFSLPVLLMLYFFIFYLQNLMIFLIKYNLIFYLIYEYIFIFLWYQEILYLNFFFLILFNHHVGLFFLLLNKTLVSLNNVIKYNWIYDLYFNIRYLHQHLSQLFNLFFG